MNDVTRKLLEIVSDFKDGFKGAFNIRENGSCAGRQSNEFVDIQSKEGLPGLVIHVKPGAKDQTVYIPACVTKGGIDDLVYNDFYIGDNADVTIVAGCGVHNEEDSEARHNGIHRFFVGKGANVRYLEKHVGTGSGRGPRVIDPVTEMTLEEDSTLEMETSQLGGVAHTRRVTKGTLGARAKLIIRERLMTDGDERAETEFEVSLDGEDAGVDLISRSVARGESIQKYRSCIIGNTRCTGHSECDSIIVGNGKVHAAPELVANHVDAAMIHEAAIGKIAGEQILKLRTLGLTTEEAEAKIIEGFLN